MPRYFFNVADNGRAYDDEEGLELPDLGAAREEAIGFARDLMRMNDKPYGRNHERWTVIVTDEKGLKVITVPFSEAMPEAK